MVKFRSDITSEPFSSTSIDFNLKNCTLLTSNNEMTQFYGAIPTHLSAKYGTIEPKTGIYILHSAHSIVLYFRLVSHFDWGQLEIFLEIILWAFRLVTEFCDS